MRGARSIRTSRRGEKAPPKKLARIGRVLSGDTAEAAAFKKMLAEVVAEAVKSVLEPYLPGLAGAAVQPAGMREGGFVERGKLRYGPGFEDVWVGGVHYDLRERAKARLCLQYLVEKGAFDASSGRHLADEIDPYVRERGNFERAANIKIHHYFTDRDGRLQRLRKELIVNAARSGRYFLKVD